MKIAAVGKKGRGGFGMLKDFYVKRLVATKGGGIYSEGQDQAIGRRGKTPFAVAWGACFALSRRESA